MLTIGVWQDYTMASPNYSNPDSLAELSALVERTLLDTGRLFRKNGSMPASTHLHRSVPSYYESFQYALDNLSEQIFIAKAYLEKDYEAIKAREAVPQPAEDVTMKEVDQKVPAAQQPPVPEKLEPGAEPEKVETKAEEGAAPAPPQPTEAIPGPQPSGDAAVKKEKEPESTAAPDQAFPESTEGMNFDSMLNTNGGSNSFDLHLDFGNDDMGNQAFLSGTAFGNTPTTGAEKPGTSLPTGTSATAAPAGGGAFDLALQTAGGENQFLGQNGGTEDIMEPGESSFDDLFMETENMGDNGTGNLNQLEGDTLMNLNELDDNWF